MVTNREKRDIWQIPEKNYVDVTYLIKEKRVNEIMTNYINNNSSKNKNKNLVLYKKINKKNNNNNTKDDIDISCNSKKTDINNNNYISNSNINKANTSYSMKIKNIFNLKFNTSNDTSIGLGVKKFEINQKYSFFKTGIKKISCDYHETNSALFNKNTANKKRNKTIYNKNIREKEKENENSEHSYAFQNLINLNKKNDSFNNNINNEINDSNKSYNIQIKPSSKRKRLGRSPDNIKFFMTESKNYFNEEKIKNRNRKTINFKENNASLENKTMTYKNDKNEYDGDMETISYRYSSFSKKNRKNSNVNALLNTKRDLKEIQNIETEIIESKNIKLNNINNINYKYNTFCSGFLVSGIPIPIKDSSIINNSTNFLASCGHKFCSLLFSIRPEILYFYKNENLNLDKDIIEQISSLAFPLGVKLCLENGYDSKKMIQVPQQIFYNIIEDPVLNKKLYLCTKYYFIKIKNEDLKNNYGFDVALFFSEKTSKTNDKNFKNYILTASRLLNGNSFYLPQSITLLSQEPFLNPMSIVLNGFIASLPQERIHIINHIINEVPKPEEFGTQIKFYIPVYSTPLMLNNEINVYKIMSLLNKEKQKDLYDNNIISREQLNYKKLYEMICLDHLIFIFSMILLEQNIIFVYNNYEILSQIIFIFVSLLYPFDWGENHIFPILSLDTLNLLNNKNNSKYIAGMDEYLFNYIDKANNNNSLFINSNNLIIYDLSQRCFIFYKNKKKANRNNILHDYKLCPFPDKVTNFLTKELKMALNLIKSNQEKFCMNNNNNNNIENDKIFYKNLIFFRQNLEITTKFAFLKGIIMLIGDYNNYIFNIGEEEPLFNKEGFIEAHKDKDFKNYLNLFLSTNLFSNFLIKQKNNDELNNIKYFIKIISQNTDLLNNQQIKKNVDTNPDIYSKAKNICSKLTLINNNNNNNNNNSNTKDNFYNDNKNSIGQKNKKKTNVLFSGKNYLEDKTEDKINSKNNNKNKSMDKKKEYLDNNNIEDYKAYMLKESKISTEASTINAFFHSINKSDIKENNDKQNKQNNIVFININSNNGNEKQLLGEKNNSIIKQYLLVPYFLNVKGDDEDYIKETKTKDTILNEINAYRKRKNIKDKIPPFTTLISTFAKNIEYATYNINKNKVYIIDNSNKSNKCNNDINNNININNSINKEVKIFKKKYFKEEKSDKDIINLNNIYGNDEEVLLINKYFRLCFLNKIEINEQHLNHIKKLFLNLENLEHFANLIYPEFFRKNNKNKKSLYHKHLTANSFNIFSKMVKISFENLNINDNNIGRLITMACFIYYKIEKDKIIYLYSNFTNTNTNSCNKNEQPYMLWASESFWIEFFNWEFENNTKDKDENENENLNVNEEIGEDDEDWGKKMCLIKTVVGVTNIMSKLNLNKNFIINIIEKMILPVFVNDFYYINLIMNLALSSNNVNNK